MAVCSSKVITRLLAGWGRGDRAAFDELALLVYDQLHRIAARRLRHERPNHTLEPTALVHEAYVKLIDQDRVHWKNRAHFFAIASRMMRRILVDHARRKRAAKREGFAGDPVSLSQVPDPAGGQNVDVLALHEALAELGALDPRQAEMVELRFFGGLTIDELAAATHVSPATVKRELTTATVWLRHKMRGR